MDEQLAHQTGYSSYTPSELDQHWRLPSDIWAKQIPEGPLSTGHAAAPALGVHIQSLGQDTLNSPELPTF